LRKYLFTHPYVRYGAEILATNDNIEKFRGITTNPNFTKQEQEMYKKRVAEMEKHLDQFWSSSPVSFMSDTMEVLSYPKKVAVLIDKGCGSTTEQFLLDPVGNSKKATIYGQPSAGVLDYANLHFFTIPNTNFRVNYATSRSKRVDIGKGIDNKGIQPHVLLDATVKDWVQYVKQQLEK
jgi:C-terminal processing protease CtpA/Prc